MPRFSGAKLREARGRRNQTDLAAALQRRGFGTTQTQVSRWESGQAPRKYILPALAAELGVSVEDLLEPDEEEDDLDAALRRELNLVLDRIVKARVEKAVKV